MDLAERSTGDHRRHPWELVRAEFFRSVLRRAGLLGTARWLDVGAGDAWFSSELTRALGTGASITCWDVNYTEDDVRQGGVAGSALRLTATRPAERFDGVLLLDVVEHVDDDRDFLEGIVRDLAMPGAHVLFSVPAYQRLFTAHDVALQHHRRYSPRQARALLTGAGLQIVAEGGLFHSLLMPRTVEKLLEVIRPKDPEGAAAIGVGAWDGGPLLSTAVGGVLRAESKVSGWLGARRLVVPGLSYWALCRAPET